MNIDAARASFIAESRELISEMELALLACERGDFSAATVNAIFRAAHTIKGNAGLFGFDAIVAFTHVVESALDKVREGLLTMDAEWAALLLECRDHMQALVDAIAHGGDGSDAQLTVWGKELVERLATLGAMGIGDEEKSADNGLRVMLDDAADCIRQLLQAAGPGSNAPAALCLLKRIESLSDSDEQAAPSGEGVANECWHVSLRFQSEVLQHGLDPLSFIRFLASQCELQGMLVVQDALPAADAFDAHDNYLGYELQVAASAEREQIEGAFEFVREQCRLHILRPHAPLDAYAATIAELPEGPERARELLLSSGALNAEEIAKLSAPPAKVEQVAKAAGEAAAEPEQARSAEQQSIRVDAGKLERLINLVGELVIAGASTHLLAMRVKSTELNEAALRMSRLVEEVRDEALKLRMMPIGATFARFSRVVRDVSRELGKEIRLETSGGDTELDKTLIEKITDPLTHLVRNSMDHGIEKSELRVKRGKEAIGTVRLNAYHDSGSVVIEVSDDGGGLNREKIFEKALQRGLVKPEDVLTDSQVYALIFEPGFSTADAVTNLSGRGVGMDVVKRNVTQLRGSVEIESTPGVGTTIRVRLPLTLAIIEGFLVRVGKASFVVPLEMVEECVESGQVQAQEGKGYLDLRGKVLPLIRLREHFSIAGGSTRRESVVVVRHGAHRAGLLVDELLGEYQTVIKPLARLFQNVRGLGGSTILGDGSVALILEVASLIEHCRRRADDANQAA